MRPKKRVASVIEHLVHGVMQTNNGFLVLAISDLFDIRDVASESAKDLRNLSRLWSGEARCVCGLGAHTLN